MRGNCLSMNKIYADPQIKQVANRIKFLQNKRSKMHLSIERRQSVEPTPRITNVQNKSKEGYLTHTTVTQENEKQARLTNRQKLLELRELKTKRYKQSKENSQRLTKVIQTMKENDSINKQLKRVRIVKEREISRSKLQEFEENKLRFIKENQGKIGINESISLKGLHLKKQLMQQEGKSLHFYEQSLSYKSQLMRKIRKLINNND